jgi:hypothetical protein
MYLFTFNRKKRLESIQMMQQELQALVNLPSQTWRARTEQTQNRKGRAAEGTKIKTENRDEDKNRDRERGGGDEGEN